MKARGLRRAREMKREIKETHDFPAGTKVLLTLCGGRFGVSVEVPRGSETPTMPKSYKGVPVKVRSFTPGENPRGSLQYSGNYSWDS